MRERTLEDMTDDKLAINPEALSLAAEVGADLTVNGREEDLSAPESFLRSFF